MSIIAPSRSSLRLPATYRPGLFYPRHVCNYLDRINAADVAAGNWSGLERSVTELINITIQNLIATGNLGISNGLIDQGASLIKASCLLCGARTLNGSLTPLVGPEPTNFNFTGLRYDRKSGLLGDGATTYLNSNVLGGITAQNSFSLGAYVTFLSNINGTLLGTLGFQALGTNALNISASQPVFTRNRSFSGKSEVSNGTAGFTAMSRSNASSYIVRTGGSSSTANIASDGIENTSVLVFRRGLTVSPLYASHRLNLYFIGEALDLVILDNLFTSFTNTLAALSI